MRALLALLILMLAGCSTPETEIETTWEPMPEDTQEPMPNLMIDSVGPYGGGRGNVQVRWPGGEWQSSLEKDHRMVVNATTVTQLSDIGEGFRFEARFVTPDQNANDDPQTVGNASWYVWNRAGDSQQNIEAPADAIQTFTAIAGATDVFVEVYNGDGWYARGGSALVQVYQTWEVHGTVQPLPVQAPGAPDVRQEIRVPTLGQWGTLVASTEALGDAPNTGRDLRLGIRLGPEEHCIDPPTPGVLDHTAHLLQAPLWEAMPYGQVYVGNPVGWCKNTYTDPMNLAPIDYVLTLTVATPQQGSRGYYY